MDTLPNTKTEDAVLLYHRYNKARREFIRLEMELQEKLRHPDVNLIEYWKRLHDDSPATRS